jgi:ATP-dependent Clp protease, protease subunit
MNRVRIRARGDAPRVHMTGTDAEVLVYDLIGADPFYGAGISAKSFREQLQSARGKTLNLRVNSPGGDVFEAGAMLAALDQFPGKVVAHVDGIAASAASYLVMGADEVRIGTNAMMMIHDPYGFVLGGAVDMRDVAALLDKVKDQILDAYQRKSKAPRDRLSAWMSAETWFTGKEAVDAGLADTVTRPVRVAALSRHARTLAMLGYQQAPNLPRDNDAWQATQRRREIAARL